jgi:hypothetical protein
MTVEKWGRHKHGRSMPTRSTLVRCGVDQRVASSTDRGIGAAAPMRCWEPRGGGEGRGGRHSSRTRTRFHSTPGAGAYSMTSGGGAIGRAAHLQRTGERRGGEEMKGTDRETEGAWTWIEFTADYTGLGLGTSTAAASSEASPEMGLGASTAAASSEASPVRGLFGRA